MRQNDPVGNDKCWEAGACGWVCFLIYAGIEQLGAVILR